MKHNPLVSVIMPAYKQAEYIGEALDSLLNQTYKGWEVIVVDDGSPDNVAQIVETYSKQDSRIKFYHTENHGVSAARNFAASKSEGEYLLPLDADDKIAPTYIQKCVEHFEKYPETTLVYCQWKYFGTKNKATPLRYKGYKHLLIENSIFNCAMFRKCDFDRVGGYDENMLSALEDWEFLIRLLNEDSVVYQIPEVLFFYRIKPVSRNTVSLHSYDVNNYIYEKHSGLFHRLYGKPIKAYTESFMYEQRYYNIWYKKLWYKYIVKDHLECYD